MRRQQYLLALLVVAAAIAPAGVAAQEDDDDSLLGEISTDSVWAALGAIRGEAEGWWLRQASKIGEPPEPADQADDLRDFVNENDRALVDHANEVLDEHNGTVRNGTYVLEVTVEENDAGDGETFYVVATGDGTDVTGFEATGSTEEPVDRSSSLSGTQAEALNEDLRTYKDDYVDPGREPSVGHLARIGSKYTDVGEIRREWPSIFP